MIETLAFSIGLLSYGYYTFKHWICKNKAFEIHKDVLSERTQ